jgi:hypothetical protein
MGLNREESKSQKSNVAPDEDTAGKLMAPKWGEKFPLGQIVITPTAMEALTPAEVHSALSRHSAGNWGELDAHDLKENERSLADGGRLLSAYSALRGERFWIITEADRSVTTILLPSDY